MIWPYPLVLDPQNFLNFQKLWVVSIRGLVTRGSRFGFWENEKQNKFNKTVVLISHYVEILWYVFSWNSFWKGSESSTLTIMLHTRREEGRCRCYERQRAKAWGNWSLSHTRWNCHTHLDSSKRSTNKKGSTPRDQDSTVSLSSHTPSPSWRLVESSLYKIKRPSHPHPNNTVL